MTDLRYSELSRLNTFDERFEYLSLAGKVADRTFGGERWMNQVFYRSYEWKQVRQRVIARDLGCDMGIEGYEIFDKVIIHHMNPMSRDQVSLGDPIILNPEFLVTVTHNTHNAIHFGGKTMLTPTWAPRTPGDTNLW